MKRLNSKADIIRITGSVVLPIFETDAEYIDWLSNLPYNLDAQETDIGVYVTVQGTVTTETSDGTDYLIWPNFELYSKWTDKNGNPCYLVRDVKGINNYSNVDTPSDLQWLYYNDNDEEIRLSAIDPTED